MIKYGTHAPEWAEIVEKAAWLWLLLEPAKRDRTPKGGVHYAIDPSIPVLFANPKVKRKKPELLGMMDDDLLTDLSFMLGAMSHKATDQPSLLLHGHASEFQTIYLAFRRQAETNGKTSPDLEQVFSGNREQTLSLTSSNDFERMKAFENIRLVQQALSTPVSRFALLRSFIRESGLRTPIAFSEATGLPIVDRDSGDMLKLAEQWFENLRAQKSARRSSYRIFTDALAVAHLAFLNRELQDTGDNEIRLLTTDDTLMRVGLESDLPGAEFLRDPRIFLDELRVKSTLAREAEILSSGKSYGLSEWLSVLISPLIRRITRKNMEVLSKGSALAFLRSLADIDLGSREMSAIFGHILREIHGKRLQTFNEEWNQFIALGINSMARKVLNDIPFFRNLGNSLLDEDHSAAEDVLRKWHIKELGDLSTTAIVASMYAEGRSEAQKTRKGSVEQLFRTRMPLAIRYSEPDEKELFEKELEKAIQERKFNDIQERDEPRAQYAVHLVSCQITANFGEWKTAEAIARMAVLLTDIANDDPGFTPSEALYAQAVCRRHLVRKPDDVNDVLKLLEIAEKHDGKDIRFRAERISLEIAIRHFQRYFQDEWKDATGPLPDRSPTEIIDELLELLRFAKGNERGESETDYLVRLCLLKQISMNAASIALLDAIADPEREDLCDLILRYNLSEFIQALEEVAEAIEENSKRKRLLGSNYFEFICALSDLGAHGGETVRETTESTRLDRVRKSAGAIREHAEFPYESQKITDVLSLLSASKGKQENSIVHHSPPT